MRVILAAILILTTGACALQADYRPAKTAPQTASPVDLERYAGHWFEIARYPNLFERGCAGVTADYSLNDDGTVDVVNTCRKGSLTGKVKQAKGSARVVEQSGNARLKVKFAPDWVPFAEGDYWILYLEQDYSAALVGDPSGKYLWVLSRTPVLDATVYGRIKAKADALGYESGRLELTLQPQG